MYFNSHPRKEDDGGTLRIGGVSDISTHILARRMTLCIVPPLISHSYFNSHPRKEDDFLRRMILCGLNNYFNSHPRKEDDGFQLHFLESDRYFNSHPRKEDDDCACQDWRLRDYFNSHPRKEDD